MNVSKTASRNASAATVGKFAVGIAVHPDALATISKRLRKERELAFYGDVDFIPTDEYTRA